MTMTPETAADLVARAYTAEHQAAQVDVAAVMSGGETRRRRRRNASSATLVGSASLAVVLATALTGAVMDAADAPGVSSPAAGEAGEAGLRTMLERPQTDEDRVLPLGADTNVLDDQSMLASSARLITIVDGVEYYAGTSQRGDICIAVGWPEGGYGSGCAELAEFNDRGVTIGLSGDTTSTPDPADYFTTLLLPDSLRVGDGREPAELVERADVPAEIPVSDIEVLTPNLLVVRPPA